MGIRRYRFLPLAGSLRDTVTRLLLNQQHEYWTRKRLNAKEGRKKHQTHGERKWKGKKSMGNTGNKASSAPISGLRRGNPAIPISAPCGQSSGHGDTSPPKSAARNSVDKTVTAPSASKKRTRRKHMHGRSQTGSQYSPIILFKLGMAKLPKLMMVLNG